MSVRFYLGPLKLRIRPWGQQDRNTWRDRLYDALLEWEHFRRTWPRVALVLEAQVAAFVGLLSAIAGVVLTTWYLEGR